MTSSTKTTIEADLIIPPLPSTVRGRGLHIDGTLRKEPRLLYCSNACVIQRNLLDFNQVRINNDHQYKANVAKFSPNGEWICSGDCDGTVNVWANKSFVIKNTIKIGKSCLDIAYDNDRGGQRIVAVGAGKDDKGKVFPWNSNNKLGELTGCSKDFLCCAFRPCRPFHVIAAGEDMGVFNYKGPPFKFLTCNREHSNYVNGVKFTPKGDFYVTVSSDKSIGVFESTTGKKVRSIKDPNKKMNHTASIYDLSFSKDGQRFITCSADRTCKIWSFAEGICEHTFRFSDNPGIQDMQVGCLWLDTHLFSVSLSGKINILSLSHERPVRILTGHKQACTDIAVDHNLQQIYTSDIDGRICVTHYKTGICTDFTLAGDGNPHNNLQIRNIRVSCDNKILYSVGADDTLCLSPTIPVIVDCTESESKNNNNSDDNKSDFVDSSRYTSNAALVYKLPGAPRFVLTGKSNPELCVIGTHNGKVLVFNGLKVVDEMQLDYEPICGSLTADDKYIAIGDVGNDNAFYIYELQTKKEIACVKNEFIRGSLLKCEFSWDGKYLATTDRSRHIWIWDFENKVFDVPLNSKNTFQYHLTIVSSLEWCRESGRLLSCGLDGVIYIWLAAGKGVSTNAKLQNSFVGGIKKMTYVNDDTIVGVGADSTVRFFKVVDK